MEAIKPEASTTPQHTSLAPMFPHPDQGVPVTESTIKEIDNLERKQQRKAQRNLAKRAKRREKARARATDVPRPCVNGDAIPQAIKHPSSQASELGEQTSEANQPKSRRRRRKEQQILETELSDILSQTNLSSPDANAENSAAPSQAPTANSKSPDISNGITTGDQAGYRADTTPSGIDSGIGASATASASHYQRNSKPSLKADDLGQDNGLGVHQGPGAVFQQKYPEFVPPLPKLPPWRNNNYPRFNTVPSYDALPIAPIGTSMNPSHNALNTPFVVQNGLGTIINTLPSTNQPARGLWTGSPPKATRYSLRSSDPQSRPAKGSPSPQKTKRQQSPANPPGSFKEKPLPAPTPSPLYLSQASLEPASLSKPQRLLLVLDLNGTLLYRGRASSSYRARPCLQPFLEYCLSQHSVLIWSSATAPNVTSICSRLFTASQRQQLLGEWGRDTLDLTTEQYYSKCQVYKRLDRIWDGRALRDSHPSVGEKWSQANTLLLDDSAAKGQAQPHNLVELPEFTATGDTGHGKEVLGQVVAYLEEARQWADISAFVKKRPFKVDAGWKWDWVEGRRVR